MTTTRKYRTNADGSAVCPHRDLTCCATCYSDDKTLHYVAGAYYRMSNDDWFSFANDVGMTYDEAVEEIEAR